MPPKYKKLKTTAGDREAANVKSYLKEQKVAKGLKISEKELKRLKKARPNRKLKTKY